MITRVYYYPNEDNKNPTYEWVEIYNPTTTPVRLNNHVIGAAEHFLDGGDEGLYRFSTGSSVGPQGYMIVTYSASAFYNKYGSKTEL